jgi:hypothetical protein
LAEVTTIVVGILLALAADAAYQYRTDRSLEAEILDALREEFRIDEVEIAQDQRSRAVKLEYIDRLRAYRRGDAPALPPDSIPDALENLLRFRFYTAGHPVLDETLNTGRLGLLRSDALRRALMSFETERERLAVIEAQEQDVVRMQVAPYLADRIDLDLLMSRGQLAVDEAHSFNEIVTEPAFGSTLYLNRARVVLSQGYTEELLEKVVEVLEALAETNEQVS